MLALLASGAVYSWGLGVFGQLGHGTLHNERWPRLVVAVSPFVQQVPVLRPSASVVAADDACSAARC